MHLRNKKQQFQNSWSVTYRKQNYDALDDPHASYYFLNNSMRKHLKSLRKSIQRQGSFTEKKKIRYMIQQRIKDFDAKNQTTKVKPYYYNMKSSSSISSLHSNHQSKQLLNEQNNEDKKTKAKRYNNQTQMQSKTLEVKTSYNQQKPKQRSKQKKIFHVPKSKKLIQLPKITFYNHKQQNEIKTLQKQVTKEQKEQKKLNTLNKTQHNKFLKFIVEHKKKLESHSKKKDKVVNTETKNQPEGITIK